MKQQSSTNEPPDGTPQPGLPTQKKPRLGPDNKRSDPRSALSIQAFVAIPSIHSRAYGLREVSRGGMFLAFTDARSTRLELAQNDVETGTNVEVAFSISLPDGKHRFRVRAQIVRINSHGIAVKFITHNPPQLAALRELFAQAGMQWETAGPQARDAQKAETIRMLAPPSDSAGWQDWELVE